MCAVRFYHILVHWKRVYSILALNILICEECRSSQIMSVDLYLHYTPHFLNKIWHPCLRLQLHIIVRIKSQTLSPRPVSEWIWKLWILQTVGRTPWTRYQPVARPLPTQKTQTQKKRRQTSITLVGFQPTILVFERAKTFHALDRTAIVIGKFLNDFSHSYESIIGVKEHSFVVGTVLSFTASGYCFTNVSH
jgi:hypothetical protein